MILSGRTFVIPFLTRNPAGFLVDPVSMPTGSISGGTGGSVVITKTTTAQYKATGTLPDMSAGTICVIRALYSLGSLSYIDPILTDTCFAALPAATAPTFAAIPFEVRNAAKALTTPDALPTGQLLVNGANSGATVTVAALTGTGKYSATISTNPTLTAGDFVVLRLLWAVNGLAGGIDCYRDWYWVPATIATDPVSAFDWAASTLTWGYYAADSAVDVVFTSEAGVAYAAKAIRRLHDRNRVQRALAKNTEKECIWQLDSRIYTVPTEEGAKITHGNDTWIVTGCKPRGYFRDFACRYIQAESYGDSDSDLWSPKAPGDFSAIGFRR